MQDAEQQFSERRKGKTAGLAVSQQLGATDFTFSIREIGENRDYSAEDIQTHRHAYFEIIWMIEGVGTCLIDMERFSMDNNRVYIVRPGHIHSVQAGRNAGGYFISFSREFLHLSPDAAGHSLYNGLLTDPHSSWWVQNNSEKSDMKNILNCMQKEFENYSLLRSDILNAWLRIFLTYLGGLERDEISGNDPTKNIDLVYQFYVSLEKNFLKKKMVVDYAGELFISPNYLNEIVKRVSGFTASHHIQQRIILEAKRLAIHTASSMKEIAYLLGFEDIAYFSKYFKTFSGSNFRDFKKNRSAGDC